MFYTVLARRYRSEAFADVVGQEPIAQTLCNAIATGRVAHAYLFTGTRGVGKTTMARLLARALNAPKTVSDCPEPPDTADDPDTDTQQRMAEAVMRGDDLNVIEIDGASNNSVDQARQLIANAALLPSGQARHKVYIIDEVHMLSGAAFNALLKTMEEPPSHVKFILCTTESHKVPVTIQSRCQRFDFAMIPTGRIAEHLGKILEREGVLAEEQVVRRVARLGRGSMRDALSVLDRLIASADGPLTVGLVDQMLGLPPQEMVDRLVDALAAGDVAGSLRQVAGLVDGGGAIEQVVGLLIERLHQLLVVGACGADHPMVDLSDQAMEDTVRLSRQFDASGLVYMIALCENMARASKTSSHPRALLDVTVVRLALAEKMADVTGLLSVTAAGGEKKNGFTTPAGPPRTLTARTTAPDASSPPPSDPGVGGERTPNPVTGKGDDSPAHQANPDGVWSRLLDSLQGRVDMAWVRRMSLVRIEQGVVYLDMRQGQRDLRGFVTFQRCGQLAELLKPILGGSVRVELVGGQGAATRHTAGEPGGVTGPGRPALGAGRPAAESGQQAGDGGGEPKRSVRPGSREQVMGLPLVRQVLDVFEATLVASETLGCGRAGSVNSVEHHTG